MLSSSSSASSSTSSPCSEFESLLGAARPRILRWIHQYASFHCMRNTRQEVEAMLQPVIDATQMQRLQEESEYRQQLRRCRDMLQQADRPYDCVGIGLETLTALCSVAQLPLTANSSFFQLVQLATITAALRAADDLMKQEEETGSSALEDYRVILVDVFSRQLPQSQPAEVRAVQAQGDKSLDFCLRYWTLLQRLRASSSSSSPLAKQHSAITATFTQKRLDAAVSAVLLEVSRALRLPLPLLNAVENDLLERRWKPSKQPLPEPSPTSVVDLPPLPIIRLPPPTSPAPPASPASPVSVSATKQQKSSRASEPQQQGGAGRLKEARRQLNRRGVDPLDAVVDAAADIVGGGGRRTRAASAAAAAEIARSSRQQQEEEEEDEEDDEEDEEEEEDAVVDEEDEEKPARTAASASSSSRFPSLPPTRSRQSAAVQPVEDDNEEKQARRGRPKRASTSSRQQQEQKDEKEDEEEESEVADDTDSEADASGSSGRKASARRGKRAAVTPKGRKPKKRRRRWTPRRSSSTSSRASSSPSAAQRSGQRRPYTSDEERTLKKGVKRFKGQRRKWKLILTHYPEHFPGRSAVDLKDKWRNIQLKVRTMDMPPTSEQHSVGSPLTTTRTRTRTTRTRRTTRQRRRRTRRTTMTKSAKPERRMTRTATERRSRRQQQKSTKKLMSSTRNDCTGPCWLPQSAHVAPWQLQLNVTRSSLLTPNLTVVVSYPSPSFIVPHPLAAAATCRRRPPAPSPPRCLSSASPACRSTSTSRGISPSTYASHDAAHLASSGCQSFSSSAVCALPASPCAQRGLFAASGVEVEWTDVKAGTGALINAVKAGEQDVIAALTEGLIADIALGSNLRLISSYVDSPLVWAISAGGQQTAVNTVDDLRGRTVAVSRFTSGSHLMTCVLASQRGWQQDDVSYVVKGPFDKLREAVNDGSAAAFMWESFMTKPHHDSGELRRIGELVTPWPCFLLAATTQTVDERLHDIQRLLTALRQACHLFATEKDAMPQLIAERFHFQLADAAAWYAAVRITAAPSIAQSSIDKTLSALSEAAILPASLNVAELQPAQFVDSRLLSVDTDIATMRLYNKPELITALHNNLRHAGLSRLSHLSYTQLLPYDQNHYYGTQAVDRMLQLTRLTAGQKAVNLGSGLGGPARYLAGSCGVDVLAVELQHDLHLNASELTGRCQPLRGQLTHVGADVRQLLPLLTSDSFDLNFSLLTVLHIPETDRLPLFRHAFRTLRPGARLFLEDWYAIAPLTAAELQTLSSQVYCHWLPSRAQYLQHLSDAGFSIELTDELTESWRQFVHERYESWSRDRQRLLAIHGAVLYDRLLGFYRVIVQLMDGGHVGGLRIMASKAQHKTTTSNGQ